MGVADFLAHADGGHERDFPYFRQPARSIPPVDQSVLHTSPFKQSMFRPRPHFRRPSCAGGSAVVYVESSHVPCGLPVLLRALRRSLDDSLADPLLSGDPQKNDNAVRLRPAPLHGSWLFQGERAHRRKYDTPVDKDLLPHEPSEASKLTYV